MLIEGGKTRRGDSTRSEEHTSELQSQSNLVCRLLLEKKKYLCSTDTLRRPPATTAARIPRPTHPPDRKSTARKSRHRSNSYSACWLTPTRFKHLARST